MMNAQELESIGFNVANMLKAEKWSDVAEQYDYALKYDRNAEEAIEAEFNSALNECVGNINHSKTVVSISHFEENSTGLESLIECDIQLEESSGVLIELILNAQGNIYLEQISSYRRNCHA